jgi:ABC-2 type transport system permease protein
MTGGEPTAGARGDFPLSGIRMRVLWVVFKREYLERVRTRWFLVATLFGPIFFGAILFLPSYMASKNSRPSADVWRVRILDATGSDLGERIGAELEHGDSVTNGTAVVERLEQRDIARAESTATRAVMARQIKGYLLLEHDVLTSGSAQYAGVNATSIADVDRIRSVAGREVLAARLREAGIAPAAADRLKSVRFALRTDRISDSGAGGSGRISLLFAVTVAILLYMTILMYGQNVLRSVVEEKQSRVSEVIVASVRPGILLAGKVLGVGAVGLTQLLIWMGASVLMVKYRVALMHRLGFEAATTPLPSISLGLAVILLVYFVLGYTLYASLFAAVGAMVSNEQDAQQAQMPVVLLLVFSVMFLQPVLNAPDSRMAVLMSWMPVSAPIVMPLRMSAVDIPAWEVAMSMIALIAACYLAVWIAARMYRTGILMYGKKATLREVGQWLRRSV